MVWVLEMFRCNERQFLKLFWSPHEAEDWIDHYIMKTLDADCLTNRVWMMNTFFDEGYRYELYEEEFP